MSEIITLKGTGDGVVIRISKSDNFSAVTDAITDKIRANRNFFRGNYKVYIESAEPLEKSDVIRLKSVIDTFLPDCEVIYREPGKVDNYSSREKPSVKRPIAAKGAVQTATVYETNISEHEHLRVVGNALIIGNVEEDALVTAGGNVIVLGEISGTVRAGYPDNREAYIAYRNLDGGEISIGEITYREDMYPMPQTEIVEEYALKKAHLIKNSIFMSKFL